MSVLINNKHSSSLRVVVDERSSKILILNNYAILSGHVTIYALKEIEILLISYGIFLGLDFI